MARHLKQSTSATVHAGPAVDFNDGITPETGLAVGTVDEIVLYKHAGTSAVDIAGTTTLTHRAGGIYTATLSTTDTATLGHLRLYIRDNSVCVPFWEDFEVMPANVWDSLYGADKLKVDVAEVSTSTIEVAYAGPVATNGDITIFAGHDYSGDSTFDLTMTGWTGLDLDGGTGKLRLLLQSKYEGTDTEADYDFACTIAQTSTTVTATISLTAANTSAMLAAGTTSPPKDTEQYRYQINVTQDSKVYVPGHGDFTVTKLIGAAS